MSVFQALVELETNNKPGALCLVVRSKGSTPRRSGSKMVVYPDGSIVGTVGGGELENRVVQEGIAAIHDGQPRFLEYQMTDPERGDPGVCGGQVEVYVEPVQIKPTIVIIGAGHVGRAVAHLAHWLGFKVVVNDDRPDFCSPEVIPEADLFISSSMAELPSRLHIDSATYLILTTRGGDVDAAGLPVLLDQPAAYFGVIGSQRRWALTKKQLIENGVSEEKIEQVRSPIGLELNAETPEEIAVSIMAEVMMLREGGDGKAMSVRKARPSTQP